jgi:hypothetical protein
MQIRKWFAWRIITPFVLIMAATVSGWCDDDTPDGSLSRGMVTRQAQEASHNGLANLARNKKQDGSFWTGPHQGDIAITSLGGLAFMAGGHQPGRGRYGQVVTRALRYVLSKEDPGLPGYLHRVSSPFHGPMYGHGFGTLFLAEVYGMAPTRQLRTELRGTLERAVKLIINSQNIEGGWRYRPERRDADISVTICQIMALRAARNAGIAVPKSVADRCTQYVKDCQDRNDGGFRYQKQFGPTGFARTAAGVVALYSAGIYDDPAVKKGLEYLKQFKPGGFGGGFGFQMRELQIHYYYGHYYAAQAMWTAGGDYWRQWYPAIRDELLRPGGHHQEDGSWFDHRICPHYCTAMALIILQIPNNYLPILQR